MKPSRAKIVAAAADLEAAADVHVTKFASQADQITLFEQDAPGRKFSARSVLRYLCRTYSGKANVKCGELMTLCELCVLQQSDGSCYNGHKTPKKMRCVDFAPGIERFCATPEDRTKQEQIKQMALFFGIAGRELKRVMAMSEDANKSASVS